MKPMRTMKRGTVTVLAVDDPLMEEIAASLRDTAQALLTGGTRHLVVDLAAVPYIDSAGLESLVDLCTLAQEEGGHFVVAAPNDLCRDILKATRLDEVVPCHPTVEEACRSFA
jgi:anti-sigma B factor antagonist